MVPSRRPCSMRLTSRRWLLGRPPPSYQCLLSTFATAPTEPDVSLSAHPALQCPDPIAGSRIRQPIPKGRSGRREDVSGWWTSAKRSANSSEATRGKIVITI